MKMYDIHMHIIPGVDDGSWSMSMSVQMLYMAYEQGIRKIIATPHDDAFVYEEVDVEDEFRQLRETVSKIFPEMQIYLGCEVRCSAYNRRLVLERLKSHKLPTLNGTNYVLTEFSTAIEREDAFVCAEELIEAGYCPVIAHVERYGKLFKDAECIEKLQNMGCLFQINVYSVYDEGNEEIKSNARRLVQEKRVTFLGSDAHRTIHRPPSVQYGLQYLYENYDKDYIDQIAFANAERLLCI